MTRQSKLNSGKLIGAYYTAGTVMGAAKELEITRDGFYKAMKRFNLEFSKKTITNKA